MILKEDIHFIKRIIHLFCMIYSIFASLTNHKEQTIKRIIQLNSIFSETLKSTRFLIFVKIIPHLLTDIFLSLSEKT